MNCEKNLKNYIIKINNLFIAHIILGGGSKILIDIEVTITSLISIPTKDSGNPYLSIYNPDTEEEYAGRYN